MPIDYRIDHERRIVIAKGRGELTSEDIFEYQREAWSQPGVTGYDELVDMTAVVQVIDPNVNEIRKLARMSAATDPPLGRARFAIVAPERLQFGLGRMYEAYRSLQPGSTKAVSVFKTLEEALAFLGLESL